MDVRTQATPTNDEPSIDDQDLKLPLLEEQPQPESPAPEPTKLPKTPAQKAIRRAFKGTAHLSNLLPTGSVLAFQVLSPVITHEGKCMSFVSQTISLGLLGLCAASCFFLCFTDSFRDERGKVRYGVATFRGFLVLDCSTSLPPDVAAQFRLRFVDFFHAFMSVLVFGSVAMFDKNVMNCFYPSPSEEAVELLTAIPVTVGVICSLLFVLFPTKRHGIGFPLSRS